MGLAHGLGIANFIYSETLSPSHELITLVADNIHVKNIRKNSLACAENDDSSGVRYLTDVMSTAFRSQLVTSHVSTHTDGL